VTNILDGILAVLLVSLLHAGVLARIRRSTESSEGRFLARVYIGTVVLRHLLAGLLNMFSGDSSFAAAFWGDSGQYDYGGNRLAMRWSGEPVVDSPLATAISGYGWVYFVASIYYVIGRNQLMVQFINGLIGGVTVLVIYAIAKDLFDRQTARWAALFMAFFPQMVFWSAGMYKDPAVLLCIAVSMYAVLGLRRRLTPGLLLLLVTAVLLLMALRFYIAYFVLLAAIGTFLFSQRRGIIGTLVVYAVLLGAIGGALRFVVPEESLAQQASYMTLERLQITREDQARWGQSGFGREYDVSTPSGALSALPVGLVHLLFAPFPWAVASTRQLLTLPETLVWYALMPAFIRGLRHGLRSQFRDILPVVVFTASLTLAYALMQGNVGTAYRQRTQVTMFFFVFMGAGLVVKQRGKLARAAQAVGARAG
jgi:4-amino-4-deoxy-L-arabinose transferase-like glycosyltransferase